MVVVAVRLPPERSNVSASLSVRARQSLSVSISRRSSGGEQPAAPASRTRPSNALRPALTWRRGKRARGAVGQVRMAAVYITAGIILLLVIATYVIQAAIVALRLAAWLLVTIVIPASILLAWLFLLPFARAGGGSAHADES